MPIDLRLGALLACLAAIGCSDTLSFDDRSCPLPKSKLHRALLPRNMRRRPRALHHRIGIGPTSNDLTKAQPDPSDPGDEPRMRSTATTFDQADNALAALNSSTDRKIRDASILARAELWIAHGRRAEVTPLLEDLASNGSSDFIRRRAKQLLVPAASRTP